MTREDVPLGHHQEAGDGETASASASPPIATTRLSVHSDEPVMDEGAGADVVPALTREDEG